MADTISLADSFADVKVDAQAKKGVLKIDGKVPDVLHVLKYYGPHHSGVIDSRQSNKPFTRIPDIDEKLDDSEEDPVYGKDTEKPIIEIVTKVFSTSGFHHHRHPPPPPPPYLGPEKLPISAAFHPNDYQHHYDPVSDEENEPAAPKTEEPYMVIHSEHLINALKAVIQYYPHFSLSGDEVRINAPYRVLYHHRQQLADYRFNQPIVHSPAYTNTTGYHIDVLLDFLAQTQGKEWAREEERHRLPTPKATFELFWMLLKPGEIIYAKRYDIWTPFVISSIKCGQSSGSRNDSYRIRCWMIESNGATVDRHMEAFSVRPWLGEQAIGSLSVVPEAFWVENPAAQGDKSMRQHMIYLGRLYWELLQRPTYMEHDGLLLSTSANRSTAVGQTGVMSGRVICDAAGFDKYQSIAPDVMESRGSSLHSSRWGQAAPPPKDHLPKGLPRCGCEACSQDHVEGDGPYTGFEDLDPLVDSPPKSELFYLVLAKTIPGFILGGRRWGHLNLANLGPVDPDRDSFKYLVLEDEVKMTVKALSSKFASEADGKLTPWGNDFVRNKGEGRIFLLHGSPGAGKTCTAECVAELTNRPLIALTSGDLSTQEYRVESNLSYFLELGQRYGALVLLDEADVYLERRRSSDISRNALVSIFLRALEYYRGVLFLTTNRVRSFDRAFMSRIHVALHYRSLRDEDRERIWASNFDRLESDARGQVKVSQAAREFTRRGEEVRSLRWNGREIRNAMQTALAMAEAEGEQEGVTMLTEKHLRAVVKLSKGFRDYMAADNADDENEFDDDIEE